MPTFAVEHIPEFVTRQRVNKLIRNGKCMIDDFEAEIKQDENIAPELDELVATIEDVANQYLSKHKNTHFVSYCEL